MEGFIAVPNVDEARQEGLSGGRMPGVIMENGSRDKSHNNHDRINGINGVNGFNGGHYSSQPALEKSGTQADPRGIPTPTEIPMYDEAKVTMTGETSQQSISGIEGVPQSLVESYNELPPEIEHITQGFQPISRLLTRSAHMTHNNLLAAISRASTIQIPSSAVNGMGSAANTKDTSAANVSKKLTWLKFAQDAHAKMVKVLVITQWSRKSEDVSKVIDLRVHLDKQNWSIDGSINRLGEMKRDLLRARLPNPDLRTALEVLTTGEAPWMPDVSDIRLVCFLKANPRSLGILNLLY